MKISKTALFMLVATVASITFPTFSLAESVDDIKQKEESTEKQGEGISSEIQLALTDVNEKYQKVEGLKEKITQSTAKIEQTESDIEDVKNNIVKRKEAVGDRMKSIQTNSSSQQTVQVLLESENFSDFLNRAYAVTVLQQAEKSKIVTLDEEQKKLNELQTTLKTTKNDLVKQESTLVSEAEVMDQKVSNLKQQLVDNQEALTQLSSSRKAEEAKIARAAQVEKEEKNKAEAQAKQTEQQAQANQQNSSTNTDSSTTETSGEKTVQPQAPVVEAAKPAPAESAKGKTISVVSTGYSYSQAGLSFYTATGIDLRQNPMVVAIDPSVIPLGSIVEVPGYGIAIAGDTGGDIVGNRIDVHFKTEAECFNWGRRSVTITVR